MQFELISGFTHNYIFFYFHSRHCRFTDKQFSHSERHGEHGDSQQHELGAGPGVGEQEEGGISAEVSECVSSPRSRLTVVSDLRQLFRAFQTKELSCQSGFRGQGQADQIRRAILGLDGDRRGRPDAREEQQGREQVHRGSLPR